VGTKYKQNIIYTLSFQEQLSLTSVLLLSGELFHGDVICCIITFLGISTLETLKQIDEHTFI